MKIIDWDEYEWNCPECKTEPPLTFLTMEGKVIGCGYCGSTQLIGTPYFPDMPKFPAEILSFLRKKGRDKKLSRELRELGRSQNEKEPK